LSGFGGGLRSPSASILVIMKSCNIDTRQTEMSLWDKDNMVNWWE